MAPPRKLCVHAWQHSCIWCIWLMKVKFLSVELKIVLIKNIFFWYSFLIWVSNPFLSLWRHGTTISWSGMFCRAWSKTRNYNRLRRIISHIHLPPYRDQIQLWLEYLGISVSQDRINKSHNQGRGDNDNEKYRMGCPESWDLMIWFVSMLKSLYCSFLRVTTHWTFMQFHCLSVWQENTLQFRLVCFY